MMEEISKMHEEDTHDDNLIAMATSNQMHTRAQMRAAENVANSHILETPDVDNDTNSPLSVRNANAKHYAPNNVVPEGKMHVVGIKAKKISLNKAVLIGGKIHFTAILEKYADADVLHKPRTKH